MIGVLDAPMIVDVPDEAQPMRLSDFMRAGAKLRPQCTCAYFRDEASCALGAAYEGKIGSMQDIDKPFGIMEIFPVWNKDIIHPYGGHSIVFDAIVSLNDQYKWTREEIADWLAGEGL